MKSSKGFAIPTSPSFILAKTPAAVGWDRDVARMVARCAGASLGLLAFCITTVAGLYAGNPATVTLSRGLLALFLFCVLGLLLGRAAQSILAEYERSRRTEIQQRYHENAQPGGPTEGPNDQSTSEARRSVRTGA